MNSNNKNYEFFLRLGRRCRGSVEWRLSRVIIFQVTQHSIYGKDTSTLHSDGRTNEQTTITTAIRLFTLRGSRGKQRRHEESKVEQVAMPDTGAVKVAVLRTVLQKFS